MPVITSKREGFRMAVKGFFAKKLKELREQAGLSQTDLSEASGIPTSTIRGFEQGFREPNYRTLVKLCRGLGMPLSAFEPPAEEEEPAPPKRPKKGR